MLAVEVEAEVAVAVAEAAVAVEPHMQFGHLIFHYLPQYTNDLFHLNNIHLMHTLRQRYSIIHKNLLM
jgi:hypothetical protein